MAVWKGSQVPGSLGSLEMQEGMTPSTSLDQSTRENT